MFLVVLCVAHMCTTLWKVYLEAPLLTLSEAAAAIDYFVLLWKHCNAVHSVPHYTFEQEGNKMYVVVDGTLEVLVKDKKVRDIGRGDAVGELALLYR
jgi:hypothetical protein